MLQVFNCSSFNYQDENMNVASLTECCKSLIVLHLITKMKTCMLLLLPNAASLYCSSFNYQDENMNVASLTKCCKSLIVLHLITKMKTRMLLLLPNAACF